MTREEVLEKVSKKREEFISWYHEFHQIPELGFEEKETTELICEKLTGMGIHPLRLDPTGVTAYVGPHDAYTVGLRADIDGLRVSEDTDLPFQSKHPGKMHACGHDGHITGLLGAASILKEMAQTDRFTITFIGKGGHAAKPHQCVDATVMAADFVMNVQTIVARELDPIEGAVVTVGSLKSGTQYNIISGKAVLEGTCRSYSEDVAQHLQDAIRRRAEAVADSYGGNVKIAYEQGSHPPVLNDVALSRRIADEAEQLLENRKLVHIAPLMLGEDFSWYQKEVPGVFAFVGCGTPGRKCYPNHHPKFEVEESALSDGVLLHLAAVVSAMHREKEE